jgi:hypothetical protein
MKRTPVAVGVVTLLLGAGVFVYVQRSTMRDWFAQAAKPTLPAARPYSPTLKPVPSQIPAPPSVVEGGVATSTHYTLESSPSTTPTPSVKVDPFASSGSLPSEANLDISFTTQSPYAKWTPQDEESCEEAATYMVDAYYRNVQTIAKDDAVSALNAVIAYETKTFGYYQDTSATTTAAFISGYFGYADVRIVPYNLGDLKQAIVNGYPVLLPTAGKLLNNPNYHNGGPLYHMIVAKGYTADGKIVTNDPGTRNGKDYLYPVSVLRTAVHDWNNGDVTNGKQVMIVVLPKT